jgi:hypothetical protein
MSPEQQARDSRAKQSEGRGDRNNTRMTSKFSFPQFLRLVFCHISLDFFQSTFFLPKNLSPFSPFSGLDSVGQQGDGVSAPLDR